MMMNQNISPIVNLVTEESLVKYMCQSLSSELIDSSCQSLDSDYHRFSDDLPVGFWFPLSR